MVHRKFKVGVFVLEGLNSFATAYYFNYVFFLLKKDFGLGNLERLSFCAANGFIYMLCAWYGGRFGQRRGYLGALELGFAAMAIAMGLGGFAHTIAGQIASMVLWTVGMCFTWPNLEALASEGESREGLKQMVGIYNLVWAALAAVAFFVGGALNEVLGWSSMFWLPAVMHLTQLIIVRWLRAQPAPQETTAVDTSANGGGSEHVRPEVARAFQRMAWLANPFAYVAINAAIPLIPEVAGRFELSTMYAGFFCSAWLFGRLGTFLLLWLWPNWHYRFGWLAGAYALLIVSFAAILLVPNPWLVLLAQALFGWGIGLIYYSSLFYSMDASDTKAEHGGVHESAIGLGIFAGPAVGALAVKLWPQHPHASAWSVSVVLLAGAAGLLWFRRGAGKS